ncbi:MAG: hypothetical protein HY739_12990 [Desulfobacterales bacterium]|nr:hypothetical protein [Desulfobacterales bacterium]
MDASHIALLTAILSLVAKIGTLPLITIIFVLFIGPWIFASILFFQQGKRLEAAINMYNENVKLVEKDQELAEGFKEIVMMNTQAMQTMVDSINTNQFCPMIRLKKQAEGVQG